jgi:hypothetical protein
MLNEDYKDMLLCLQSEGVNFILVGAYALAAHGFPRATLDIDIWVEPTVANAQKVYKALTKFGAPLKDISKEDLVSKDTVFQIGVPPRRIDIITGITGVEFAEAIKDAIQTEVEDIKLKILSLKHIKQNKIACGRHKDLADIEMIDREL